MIETKEMWMIETVCAALEERGLKKEGVVRATGNPHWLALALADLHAGSARSLRSWSLVACRLACRRCSLLSPATEALPCSLPCMHVRVPLDRPVLAP